jgi:hypothetical protein
MILISLGDEAIGLLLYFPKQKLMLIIRIRHKVTDTANIVFFITSSFSKSLELLVNYMPANYFAILV